MLRFDALIYPRNNPYSLTSTCVYFTNGKQKGSKILKVRILMKLLDVDVIISNLPRSLKRKVSIKLSFNESPFNSQ